MEGLLSAGPTPSSFLTLSYISVDLFQGLSHLDTPGCWEHDRDQGHVPGIYKQLSPRSYPISEHQFLVKHSLLKQIESQSTPIDPSSGWVWLLPVLKFSSPFCRPLANRHGPQFPWHNIVWTWRKRWVGLAYNGALSEEVPYFPALTPLMNLYDCYLKWNVISELGLPLGLVWG